MKEVKIRIQGITPLLCNRFQDPGTKSTIATKGNPEAPKVQSEKKLYICQTTGKPIIPGPNVFRCIIDAGKFFKNGASKVTTLHNSIIPACLSVIEFEIPIVTKHGWTVDSRAIVNPKTKGRMMCYRPCFHDWQLNFTIEVDLEIISLQLIRDILDAAGKKIGLGDFRPDRKGPFGKFVVTKWIEKK